MDILNTRPALCTSWLSERNATANAASGYTGFARFKPKANCACYLPTDRLSAPPKHHYTDPIL